MRKDNKMREGINESIYDAFEKENIFCVGIAKLSELNVVKEYLLPKGAKTAIVWLLPYNVGRREGNISLYARTLDYHFIAKEISDKVIKTLKEIYPENDFYCFSDHSPIAEVAAAASLGLGVIGENHLLINDRYGSFVFVSTVFTDLEADYDTLISPKKCPSCMACVKACPTNALERNDKNGCLSAINQKKGALTESEKLLIVQNNMVWGCDACQLACPLNKNAENTPIEFFYDKRIESVTSEIIENMNDDDFKKRAFSFRGKEPILRNLTLLSK